MLKCGLQSQFWKSSLCLLLFPEARCPGFYLDIPVSSHSRLQRQRNTLKKGGGGGQEIHWSKSNFIPVELDGWTDPSHKQAAPCKFSPCFVCECQAASTYKRAMVKLWQKERNNYKPPQNLTTKVQMEENTEEFKRVASEAKDTV